MADHDSIVSSDKLEAIANAIRAKTQKEGLMTLDDMPDEIASISGGGGATPECGIVPTSWSSNGFVLTANSYGDVLPGMLHAGWASIDGGYGYPQDTHDPTVPDSIDPDDYGDVSFTGTQVYNYLRSLTFVTAPTTIGHDAFSELYWMEIDELPEGLEVVEEYAFSGCSNLKLTAIPSTVTSIDDYAFNDINHSEAFLPNYSDESTYSIGDVIAFSSEYNSIYTCIEDIDEPEYFDEHHWVEGNFPELVGIYDESNIYQTGDIVYDSNQELICTCLQVDSEIVLIEGGYFPELLGLYDPTQQYIAGDVVSRYTEVSDGEYLYICYVCKSPVYTTGDWVSELWDQVAFESNEGGFKLSALRFLGTPEYISNSAFDNSGYNMILVPWEYGEGPEISEHSGLIVVYGYNPESNSEE